MLITVADLGPGVLYIIVERPDRPDLMIVNRRPSIELAEPYPETCEAR